jgi:AcrR family transcriptional regulator
MVTESPPTRRVILEAAEEVIRRKGMGGATTRAIAERAGCAEGTIYRHFPDKDTLLCEIIRASFPGFHQLMSSLPARAGTGTVRETLEDVARNALAFFRGVIPLVAGPLNDHDLLLQQRRFFLESHTGPLETFATVEAYLAREQDLGRVAAGASPPHVARLLLGSCFGQAFVEAIMGDAASLGTDAEFGATSVAALLPGLAPVGAAAGKAPRARTGSPSADRSSRQRVTEPPGSG